MTFSCLNPVKSRVVSTGTQEKARVQESMPAVSMISASPLFLSPELKKLLVKQKKAARKRINQKHVFLSAVCRVPKAPRWTLAGEDTPQSSMGLQRGGRRAAHREAARKPSRSGYFPVSVLRIQKPVLIKEVLTRAQQYFSVPLRHTAVI